MGVFSAAKDLSLACANDNESIAAFLLDARGQAAALGGLPLVANPYREASFEAACWSAGWLAGRREMGAPSPIQRAARVRPPAMGLVNRDSTAFGAFIEAV